MTTKTTPPSIAVELALAMGRLRSRLRAEQAPLTTDLNMTQLSVLGRLSEAGTSTASQLAQVEHMRQQSIAETVATLRAKNLVHGEPDPKDGRKTLLSLTSDGINLVESIVTSRGFWLARAIDGLVTDDEREVLITATGILSRIAESQLEEKPVIGWRI